MTLSVLKEFLLWCLVVDYALLLLWFILFVAARGWMYRLHARWFRMSESTFDLVHYAGMAAFKLAIVLFNLAPLLAIVAID